MNYLTGFLGSTTTLQSKIWGALTVEAASFTSAVDGDLVVHVGSPFEQPAPLVRIHSICTFSEVFDSDMCDCAEQLHMAMGRMVAEGHGLLFYLRFEARGAGLAAKVKATALEVEGMDTYDSRVAVGVEPESRDFSAVGRYLSGRGLKRVKLLTNNPKKVDDIARAGVEVIREPLVVDHPNEKVRQLLETKARRFQHLLPGFRPPA